MFRLFPRVVAAVGGGLGLAASASIVYASKEESKDFNVESDLSEHVFHQSSAQLKVSECIETIRKDLPTSHPERTRIVILGTGWVTMKLLEDLDTNRYDVIVVSPRNYFLFTPLLPGATVGAVESRSIISPIRNFIHSYNKDVTFIEATCTNIDYKTNTVTIEDQSIVQGSVNEYVLKYDYLVVAVGAKCNTFGIDGIKEHCWFLKEIWHARKIRTCILDALETACFAGQPEEERKRLCHFVVVGGGPTGCEFAADLSDFIHEDLSELYPELVPYLRVTLVQSGDDILNMFNKELSDYAAETLKEEKVNLMTSTCVLKVEHQKITVQNRKTKVVEEIPFEVCIWSTGVKPSPLAEAFIKSVPEQSHARAITTNHHLRVLGAPNVFAAGDCATIKQEKMVDKLVELFAEADKDHTGQLDKHELTDFIEENRRRYPHINLLIEKYTVDDMITLYDKDGNGKLSLSEFKELITQMDKKVLFLPATAQVAAQQGHYLANYFNKLDSKRGIPNHEPPVQEFRYHYSGMMANLGSNKAMASFPLGDIKGHMTFLLWMAYYWNEQLLWRNKFCVAGDWFKTFVFGRDVSRV